MTRRASGATPLVVAGRLHPPRSARRSCVITMSHDAGLRDDALATRREEADVQLDGRDPLVRADEREGRERDGRIRERRQDAAVQRVDDAVEVAAVVEREVALSALEPRETHAQRARERDPLEAPLDAATGVRIERLEGRGRSLHLMLGLALPVGPSSWPRCSSYPRQRQFVRLDLPAFQCEERRELKILETWVQPGQAEEPALFLSDDPTSATSPANGLAGFEEDVARSLLFRHPRLLLELRTGLGRRRRWLRDQPEEVVSEKDEIQRLLWTEVDVPMRGRVLEESD